MQEAHIHHAQLPVELLMQIYHTCNVIRDEWTKPRVIELVYLCISPWVHLSAPLFADSASANALQTPAEPSHIHLSIWVPLNAKVQAKPRVRAVQQEALGLFSP